MKKCIKTSLLLLMCLTMIFITACKDAENIVQEEEITLVDPVGVKTPYAVAEEISIVVSSTYSAVVYPEVKEYSYEVSQTFSNYGVLPGDMLKKGDNIIYADIESLKEQIKASSDRLKEMNEAYVEFMTENNKNLEELEADLEYYEKIVHNFEKLTDAEKNSYAGRDYAFYQSEYRKYDSYYRNTYLAVEKLKEQIKERTELFELDYKYNRNQHNKLLEKQKTANMKAEEAGVLVGITYASAGNRMNAGSPVAAVGNLNVKMLSSGYISKSTVIKAKDIYAVVNGKRYEVIYHEIDSDEYERIEEAYGTVNSNFTLIDPENEVAFGSYASIVIVKEERENAICIPKEALNKDDDGYFVYLYDGNDSVKQEVKIEKRLGAYVQLSYGLKDGDKVLCEIREVTGNKTATVGYGSISSNFSASGYLFYPSNVWVTNPVEYGKTYVDEICVSRYQKVEKGDVLAKIHVEMDKIDLDRQERTLLRAKESLEELIEADKDKKEEDKTNTKAIESQREYISDLEAKIKQIKSDAKIVEIKAPFAGIVTDLVNYSKGDFCYNGGNIVCISEENSSYILVEDANGALSYGNQATITYKNAEDANMTVYGTVVTSNPNVLTNNLKTGYALISIPKESIGDMAGSSMGYEGWWNRSRFNISVETRKMDNVLLVPRSAVDEEDGVYYVSVVNEDGSISRKTFIAGGFDNSNYWVVDGLTEGTVVCLE